MDRIMQQSKLFYPQHDTYASRPLDRPDAPPNRPFSAFVLPENLASVGTPSLYHPTNQEKDICTTPPAGFHMAPCGCFFDPRIYRIEWATANFFQPLVYKLSGGPAPQNTYILEGGQKYLKNPIQPVPYSAYQGVGNNPPLVLPFFKPEEATAPVADGCVGPLAPRSQFVEVAHFHGKGPVPSEEHRLPGDNLKEQSILAHCVYEPLEGHQDLAFQAREERQLKESDMARGLATHPDELSVPGGHGLEATEDGDGSLEGALSDENGLLDELDEPFSLPDKVLLEVAMKLFDCSSTNSDSEVSLDGLSDARQSCPPGDAGLKDAGLSGEDSSSDIRSLNLPDELLSFDYSVPEILSAVTSLDYLYDVSTFREESQWDPGTPSPSAAKPPETRAEREEKTNQVGGSQKNKSLAGKPKPALVPGSGGECWQPGPATPAI